MAQLGALGGGFIGGSGQVANNAIVVTKITPSAIGGQVLSTNAGATACEWATPTAGKFVKGAVTQWTSTFSSSSSSTDITDATVTISGLDSAKTYMVFSSASNHVDANTAGNSIGTQLLINGTAVTELLFRPTLTSINQEQPNTISGMLSCTGATSYIAKLQTGSGMGGTGRWNQGAKKQEISVIAIEV